MTQDWEGGMFGCLSDIQGCLYQMCCTPCAIVQTESWIQGYECNLGQCLGYACNGANASGAVYFQRQSLRAKYNIQDGGGNCGDCCWSCLCPYCVGCLNYRTARAGAGR